MHILLKDRVSRSNTYLIARVFDSLSVGSPTIRKLLYIADVGIQDGTERDVGDGWRSLAETFEAARRAESIMNGNTLFFQDAKVIAEVDVYSSAQALHMVRGLFQEDVARLRCDLPHYFRCEDPASGDPGQQNVDNSNKAGYRESMNKSNSSKDSKDLEVPIPSFVYAVEWVEVEFGQRPEGYMLYLDRDHCVKHTTKSSDDGAYEGGYYGPERPCHYVTVPWSDLSEDLQKCLLEKGQVMTRRSWGPRHKSAPTFINL